VLRKFETEREVRAFLTKVRQGHIARNLHWPVKHFAMSQVSKSGRPNLDPHQVSIDLVDLRPARASKAYPVVHVHFKGKRAHCDETQPCHGQSVRNRQHRCSNDDIYRTVLQINLRHWADTTPGSTTPGKHVVDNFHWFEPNRRWWKWVVPREGGGFGAQPPSPRHPQKEPNGAVLPLMELCFPSPRVGEEIRFIGENRALPRWTFGAKAERFHALWEVVRGADLHGARIRPIPPRDDPDPAARRPTTVFVTLDTLEREFELEDHRDVPSTDLHRSCLLNCCSVGLQLGRMNRRLSVDEYAQRMPPDDDVAAAAAAIGALDVAEDAELAVGSGGAAAAEAEEGGGGGAAVDA
jgi:hypothetical protein